MDPDRLLRPLDREQRAAVTSDAAPLAIVATAGSGKTRVLTSRIAYRVATDRADAAHVLALTFTREAAAELRTRLRRLDVRQPILAGTFHAVALALLRDHARTRHRPAPVLAPDRLRLLRECLDTVRLDLPPSAAAADLDWARARLIAPAGYERAVRQARRRSNVPAARFADLADAYQLLKQRRRVVDFDDLLELTVRAARVDKEFGALVRWRFRHLFVDEAQDLNPLQFTLLETWRAERPDITLVGDPRQAIFGWNGADPELLGEIEQRLPAITVLRLSANHRCTPQVVRAGSAALGAAGLADDTSSVRSDGPPLTVVAAPDERAEVEAVCGEIRLLVAHRSLGDIAVLARTNDQLDAFDAALAVAGVPTSRAAGRSPLDVALADAYRQRTREALAAWAESAEDDTVLVRRRVALEAIRFLASDRSGTLRAWVEEHAPFDDLDPGDAEPAVALLSFHAAKGREWPVVYVTGVEQGLVPHSSATSAVLRAEEARLLYVALTRASERLTITHAARRRTSSVQPSPWLAAVAGTAEADAPAPPPSRHPSAAADPLAPLRAWRAGVARAAGVADSAVCPDRVLRSLQRQPPADVADLALRLGISPKAAARLTRLPTPPTAE